MEKGTKKVLAKGKLWHCFNDYKKKLKASTINESASPIIIHCHFDAYKIVLISKKWEFIQFENLILENFVNVPCRLSNNSYYYINKKWA